VTLSRGNEAGGNNGTTDIQRRYPAVSQIRAAHLAELTSDGQQIGQ
jgi:hypothetical protein